ncbi:MAG: hypothetical protein SGILL_007596 [Bacillariaceae sp.]
MTTSAPTTTQQPRPALSRATYVHVSDLTSAYNIDHARLEQELARVKAERETSGVSESVMTRRSPSRRPEDDVAGKVNTVVDKKRVDQSRVRLAEVEIGDETGSVSLRARDEQIDLLEEVSKRSGAVVLRNCTLELYQGKHIRLAVTKWGKLSTYPDNVASTPPPPSKMNVDRNFSLIDLSVVASEMVNANAREDSPYGGGRQGKGSDRDPSGNGTGGMKSSSSKSGHSTAKHQQSQSSRRNRSGDRRQSRGKNLQQAAPLNVHYGGIKQDSRQQPPHPGQVMYHAMPGFAAYDQSMGMRQYPHAYTHAASRQDVSAQQIMMHQQQYDIQQRQLHHMYGQDVHRQDHQIQQAPQMMLRTMGSFDTNASSYAGEIATTPLLVPIGMPPGTSATPSSKDQFPSPSLESHSTTPDGSIPGQRSSGAMSPFPHSLGKMNPDASSYTPTYLSAAQGKSVQSCSSLLLQNKRSPLIMIAGHAADQQHHHQQQQQGQGGVPSQFTYDMAQRQGVIYPPYPGFYTTAPSAGAPGVPYAGASTGQYAINTAATDSAGKGQQSPATASPGTTNASPSGKENFTT